MAAKGFAPPGADAQMYAHALGPDERGAALVLMLVLLAVLGVSMLLERRAPAPRMQIEREMLTARSLAEARTSLIAWAVSVPSTAGKDLAPGLLPFPDRHRDGYYDGKGDCVTFGLNDAHLLGRLPWAGDASPCPRIGLNIDLRDGAGEPLWYAVSRNLLARGRRTPVNPDIGDPGRAAYPWIVLRNARGAVMREPRNGAPLPVAAVMIAPGPALAGQDRSAAAPGPAEFLDSVRSGALRFDNADADGCPDALPAPCGSHPSGEEFIAHGAMPSGQGFNDRLSFITVAELMRAVEKRVLGEAAVALKRYRDDFGVYPWLAEFRAPRSVASAPQASFKSNLARAGQLPVHLRDELFATGFGGSWTFIDATPTSATRHSGDARLVPPLADGMSGSIQVAADFGRCLWSDWSEGNCTGIRVIPAHYRPDLGTTVSRTVEYAFHIVDRTPQVTPPSAGDVRRRSLSVSALRLPRSPSVPWNLRITDRDGVNMGQRDVIIDADTGGAITLSGIRFDLSVVYDGVDDARDELPEWFAENEWHHFIYAAISSDAAAGGDADGDGDCATPVNTCLTLNVAGKPVKSDVRALVVSSGARLPGQERAIGDCDGDRVPDDFLCAYFEGENSDKSTPAAADTYARGPLSATFNDQLRIVEPLPP